MDDPHPEEAPTGPRKARTDDRLHAVSKDGDMPGYNPSIAFHSLLNTSRCLA